MFAKQMFVFSVRAERDLFVKSSANFDVNVSGISQTCFLPLAAAAFTPGDKTKSGCSCGITTNPVKSDERSKLETTQEVKRDKNLKCSSSPLIPTEIQFISN